jgi:hypothetical protein
VARADNFSSGGKAANWQPCAQFDGDVLRTLSLRYLYLGRTRCINPFLYPCFELRKMHNDTAAIPPPLGPESPSKARILTLGHLDRRTRASRRAAALAEAFAAEIGGSITDSLRIRIETAAALSVIAEDAQTRRLAGDSSVSLDDLVRAVSAARRALRDIGIRPPAKREQLGPTLAQYIASKRNSSGAGG